MFLSVTPRQGRYWLHPPRSATLSRARSRLAFRADAVEGCKARNYRMGGNLLIPMPTLICAIIPLLIAASALILAVAARAALDPEVARLTPPATRP